MNPSTDQAAEIPPQSQPQRLSTSCNLHPNERFSGFCPSCLCDKLSILDNTPPPKKPPTGSLKSLFNSSSSRTRPGFFPELRRTKSFSTKNNEGLTSGFEPQRHSCDVRLREETRKSNVSEAVLEVNEEQEEAENEGLVEEMKPMKEYMDLYPPQEQTKKASFAVSLFSGFNKKLQKWKQNKKIKKTRNSEQELDTDPRFSLDAARFSLDTGRISVDKPRASLDGHLTGKSTLSQPVKLPQPKKPVRLPQPKLIIKNASVNQTDMQDPNNRSDPVMNIPGGSNQTREYYYRANSVKKTVKTEIEEFKSVSSSNSKVSPAINDDAIEPNNNKKKSRRWGMLGFMYRKKEDDDDRYSRSNSTGMVERSLQESLPEMRRSNSNVSWRSERSSSRSKDGDNGMLRFYLTPGWRSGGGWEKTAAKANSHGHSLARRVMRLY